MTREEKEKLVKELHAQGMTYAQIAKEAHVSLRDIGPILNEGSQSVMSRALELYHQQKTPVEVAIILGLEADEAIRLHRQYYTLLGCTEFTRVYPEIKKDPWSYLNLVNLAKNQHMNTEHVGNLLKIANNDLPSIEARYRELEKVEPLLNTRIQETNAALQRLNDRKSNEENTLQQLRSETSHLKEEIKALRIEKTKIENTISHFKADNETSIWIKKMVRQEMESLQSNPRRLLRCALASIFQSETNHPGKLMALYCNNPPMLLVERIISISQIEQYPGQYRFDGDNLEKLLLDEAEQFLTRIVESLANKCLNEITNDTPRLQVLNMPPGPSVNEGSSTAINVSKTDTEPPSKQVPHILSGPSLDGNHDTNPNASLDEILISEIYNNWLNEYVKSLGVADE